MTVRKTNVRTEVNVLMLSMVTPASVQRDTGRLDLTLTALITL